MQPDNYAMGQRIRKRRGDYSLSLRDLAKKTSLTASFLSQIERGVISPSLNSLRKISEALDVPLLYFLSDTSERPPVVRADSRAHIDLEDSAVNYQLLTPDISHKMEAVMGSLESCSGNVVRSLPAPTEEFVLVLSGALRVVLEDETYILNVGDTIYFEGANLRELSCASDDKVTWVSVITPPVF